MKKAVFLGAENINNNVYSNEIKQKLRSHYDFDFDGTIADESFEEFRDILNKAEYAFSTWGMPHLTKEQIMDYLPNLKAVFYAAGTVQKFAREFLECGISVFSAWAANAVPVAEYTFAQIVLASKGYFQRLHRQHLGDDWHHRNVPVDFPGAYEVKVGIIGAGMIGKMVIEKLKTLPGCRIMVYDPFLPDERASELGVVKTTLDEVFSECDIISNHLADNEQTKKMLTGKHFDMMRRGAVFINTGRGAQVDEEGLISALEKDNTKVALLDVTMPEPPEKGSKIYLLDNIFLTPHIAGSIGNEVHRMSEYMFEESLKFDRGEPTRYSVTLKMLETMA